jgi:hypothetical protein
MHLTLRRNSSYRSRDAWLNLPGLDGKELQKRTLTNLYNARPDWLAAAHRRLAGRSER